MSQSILTIVAERGFSQSDHEYAQRSLQSLVDGSARSLQVLINKNPALTIVSLSHAVTLRPAFISAGIAAALTCIVVYDGAIEYIPSLFECLDEADGKPSLLKALL